MHRPAQRNMPLKRRAGRAVSRGRELFPTRLCGRGKIFLAQLPLFLLDWGEEGIMVENTREMKTADRIILKAGERHGE